MPNVLAPLWLRTAFGDGLALRQATGRAQDMEFRRRQLNGMQPPEAEAINAYDLDHQRQALELDRLLPPIELKGLPSQTRLIVSPSRTRIGSCR
jgi:hypothetical protein